MQFLCDENLPKAFIVALRHAGHQVDWAREQFPTWSDSQLLEIAETRGLILLTFDKGFLQLAQQRRNGLCNAGVIVYRIHPAIAERLLGSIPVIESVGRGWIGYVCTLTVDGVKSRIAVNQGC